MSSIFKGLRLNEGIDFDALQAEGQRKKDAINANPEMYSKKYGIPMDHKHFLGAVLVAMDREEQRERQQKRDAEYKANQEASHTKQLAQDKENIGQLKAQLVQLQKGFDPYYDRSDDYTFWNEQNRIAGQIRALKKRISNVEGQQLDELSNEKLGQYKTAAASDAGKADLAGDYKKADKRFSGIVKATKKQFANDAKTVKEDINAVYKEAKSLLTQLDESTQQQVINALKKNVDAEKDKQKSKYPRLDNPKILGTNNKAKSIYYPPSRPNVKKLDKPLPESLGDQLKSKSLDALQQVKQNIEQQRMADLEQWEKDFKQNTVSKFTARQPSFMQQQPKKVARPLEKHSVLKARLAQLDKAIEKQAVLDKMLQRLDAKGLLTPAIQSDTDTSMLVRDGANDNYVSLNQKLDKALEFVKNRLLTNKAAFAKPKAIDEQEELDENLHKWFKEKWVRFGPDGKIRGDCARGDDSEGKPKCLPQSKAHSLGKKGRASAASRKRREDPNPERSGKAINVNTKKKSNEGVAEGQLDELSCWSGYHRVAGTKAGFPGSCAKNKTNEDQHSETCPHCGGEMVSEELMNEKKDACYYKVKSRYKVWPSAYASGALVKCRKKGASNWGNGGKSNESVAEGSGLDNYRQRVNSQGFTDSPEEREADRSERKRRHQDALNRISDIGGGSSDEERAHQAQQRMARDEYKLDRLKRNDDDWENTFDMMRDRMNRYQWSSQRDVDPEQLAAISNIKYEPKQKNETVQAKTDDKLLAYYAQRKAEKQKQQSQSQDQLDEKWSQKYKDSINCSNPKGFSQKAHCAGKQKNESAIMKGLKL